MIVFFKARSGLQLNRLDPLSSGSIQPPSAKAGLGRVSQITTIQQAGTSSVAGFNQAEQIAKALGGLNKN